MIEICFRTKPSAGVGVPTLRSRLTGIIMYARLSHQSAETWLTRGLPLSAVSRPTRVDYTCRVYNAKHIITYERILLYVLYFPPVLLQQLDGDNCVGDRAISRKHITHRVLSTETRVFIYHSPRIIEKYTLIQNILQNRRIFIRHFKEAGSVIPSYFS